MLIKRENKNQNKQCGAVNPVHEYLILYRQFQEIGQSCSVEIKHKIIPYSHHLRCKWEGNNSLRWPEQCLVEHVGHSTIYNSRLNYVKRKHFLLKIVPSDRFGVVLPMPGGDVTGISGRVPLMDEASTLKSPSFPSLAASLSIFSIRFSVTVVLKLRVRSTITLPHL